MEDGTVNPQWVLPRVITAIMSRVGHWALPLMVASALGVLLFTVAKAHFSSFTHDESVTWARYVHLPMKDLLEHRESYTNNHMLNSILMKGSEGLFGDSELALRLPNLLALVVYLVYAALLARRLGPVVGLLTYLLLCYGAHFMELFALARGYGLSYGCLLMALHHGWRSLETYRPLHVALLHAALVLMVLSSFVTAQVALAMVTVLPVAALWSIASDLERKRIRRRMLVVHAALTLVSVILLREPLRKVMNDNSFEFGGGNGFVHDTFSSLVHTALPTVAVVGWAVQGLWILFLLLMCAMFLVAVRTFRRTGAGTTTADLILWPWGVLLATVLVMVVQHALLDTPYPKARFSKFLYPLLLICLGASCSGRVAGRWALWSGAMLTAAALVQVASFIGLSSVNSSVEWQYDMDTERIMDVIRADLDGRPAAQETARIGHAWVLEPTINFYRVTKRIPLEPAHREGPSHTEDYLVLNDTLAAQADLSGYRFMGWFGHADLLLFRRTIPR